MLPKSLLGKTLYQKRKFAAGWFFGLMAMTILTLSFFPAFKNGNLGQVFNNLSPALQKVVGDTASFKTIGGYISQQLFALRIPLLTTVLAIVLFNGLTVGEERKGLLETQLSLPLSRSKILAQKLLAGFIIVLAASIGILVGVIVILLVLNEHYSLVLVVKQILGSSLVGLCFGLVAFLFGSFGKKGLAVGISSALAFLSYLITSLVVVVPSLANVEKISLFHYQNPTILTFQHALVLAIVALALIISSFVLFARRDIGT